MEKTTTSVSFEPTLEAVKERLAALQPEAYGRSRNYADGAVSYLSPYISRGVISTRKVYDHLVDSGHHPKRCEKFIQELAWRDYWQLLWKEYGDRIDRDLRHPQASVERVAMAEALLTAETGIEAVDDAIEIFYESGYLHNHLRMYVAAIACNVGRSHWFTPAQWMYYHLLDGDWASNALSWQWVAGSNSNKKYVANQENINKYCHSRQRGTFLDVPYSAFEEMTVPEVLKASAQPDFKTPLPGNRLTVLKPDRDVAVYTYYNLDPEWRQSSEMERVLLLEPSLFDRYPVSQKCIDFTLGLANQIPGMHVAVMEFEALANLAGDRTLYFKEHPLNSHFSGQMDDRDWMTSVKGAYRSFFGYWKKAKKELV